MDGTHTFCVSTSTRYRGPLKYVAGAADLVGDSETVFGVRIEATGISDDTAGRVASAINKEETAGVDKFLEHGGSTGYVTTAK